METDKSIDSVYNFWNDRPCNIKHSNKQIGSKQYFEEVTKRKYLVEPHIINFANFSNYNVGCHGFMAAALPAGRILVYIAR
jgi:hypothetical protein